MDLLLKNPSYFYETYFDFYLEEWIPVLLIFLALAVIWIFVAKIKRSRWLLIAIHASYGAFVLGITVFNRSRVGTRNILINPFSMLIQLLTDSRCHVIRATLSNMILFIPVGLFSGIKMRTDACSRAVIISVLFSSFIEIMQFHCCRGTFETLDIICNVFGAWFGAALIHIIYKKSRDMNVFIQK